MEKFLIILLISLTIITAIFVLLLAIYRLRKSKFEINKIVSNIIIVNVYENTCSYMKEFKKMISNSPIFSDDLFELIADASNNETLEIKVNDTNQEYVNKKDNNQEIRYVKI